MAKKKQSITWTNERRKLADLIPWEHNPRTIKQKQAERLVDSVETFGQVETLAVDCSNNILNGHQRYSVLAGQYGMDYEVDVRVASRELTERERQQLTVYLHKGAAGDWEPQALFENFNLDDLTAWGFNTDELDEMFADFKLEPEVGAGTSAEPQTDKAEAEKINERYQVKKGDVWKLGQHTIACIDSCDRGQVLGVIGDANVNFVWADPPYGIAIVAANESVGGGEAYDIPFGGRKKAAKGLGSTNGAKPFGSDKVRATDRSGGSNLIAVGKYAPVIGDETIDTAIRSSSLYLGEFADALHIWWGANYYAHCLPPSSCWVVWDKENTGNFADAELAWCSSKTAVRIFKHMWNGMLKESEHGTRRVHPTQKPIALAKWAMETYGKANDVIVDPFLGSGISVLAAEELNDGRSVFGFELAPEYIAVTIHRWEDATGQKAHRATR